jgi:hypothetical protein
MGMIMPQQQSVVWTFECQFAFTGARDLFNLPTSGVGRYHHSQSLFSAAFLQIFHNY